MSESEIAKYKTEEMPIADACNELVEYATKTADPFVSPPAGEVNKWHQPPNAPGGCACIIS